MIVLSVRFVFYYLQISFHTLLTYISLQVICATDNGVNIYTTTTFSNTFNTLLAMFITVFHKVTPSENLISEGIFITIYIFNLSLFVLPVTATATTYRIFDFYYSLNYNCDIIK